MICHGAVKRPVKPKLRALQETLVAMSQQEDLNFLLTNRIPRRAVTRFMGWFSKIEQPLVRDASIAAWKAFSPLELEDAARTEFRSMHDLFTRELKPGARPFNASLEVLASPVDGIVGACGPIEDDRVYQTKGFPYRLSDMLPTDELVERYRDGQYVTIRLPSWVYHRFHAPHDGRLEKVTYISGDTWNTNPIALERVEKLFCKNERAVLEMRVPGDHPIAVVPVAAILVASIRLHCLDLTLHLAHRGPNVIDCDVALSKGEELGWFEHGSTVIVFAPKGFRLAEHLENGFRIRAGEPLMRLPD